MTPASTTRRLEHVISSEQFDRESLDDIFVRADALAGHRDTRLAGRIMATLFYEPSTRTRLSFESAMLRLGGAVMGTEAAREFSSVIKGETLEDTIRMVSSYADVIVLRHDQAGAAASVPVVNAGDGPGEHPTQALLDLYTIRCERGSADGAHIAFCGDLRFGRTVHSLVQLLSLYPGVRMSFVAPEVVQVGADLQARMAAAGVPFQLTDRLDEVISSVDVVYQTRVQKERFTDLADFEAARRAIRIDAEVMRALPQKAIVMHPLPRVDEIATEVDSDPRAAYFRQARNGVAVRMAVLDLLLG
jgi:aspartate carbamoyltransferase catalytic subunit